MNQMMSTITDNLRVVSDHQYELEDSKNAAKDLSRRLELQEKEIGRIDRTLT